MLTLNQIIAQIQALATAHAQVASSGVGTLAEWQANPDRVYPLIWLFHERTDVTDSAIIHRIRLIAADRVKVGESGEDNIGHEQEVLSDMLSVLLDFVAYFAQQHGQSYIVERSGSIEPFTERGNDRVAGVSYVLNVRQPIDFSKCQIPQSGATIPPSVDGLTLYDFCDPAVIARLTPSQVACLEAEFGVACDPVTLTINGTNVGSEPSGGEFNINVTLDGSPAGSWDGVDTWEVTSAPCPTPTLTVTSSNATPTFGASVTLTATPTNITPSGYVWYANGNQIGTGNGLAWTVNVLGSISITCVATDGTLTVQGSSTITSTYVRRTSIYTDGVNDFVRGYWRLGSAGGRALTASFYLKYVSGTAFFIRIGEQVDGQNYTFLVQPSSTGPAFNFRIGGVIGFYTASQAVTAGVWYHVVMTYRCAGYSTANPVAIYVNGSAIFTNATPSGLLQIVKPSIQLGLPDFGGAASVKFHGLSLFEDCISAAQAATLYNGGTPLNDPTLAGINRSEWFGGFEVAQVPSTNTALPYTKVLGVNGGVLNCNNNYASPFGLVTDIP